MTAILFCLLTIPRPLVAHDRCDVVETNHYYDGCGRLVFDQVIFHEWSPRHERYLIRDWRLKKNIHVVPHGRGATLLWHDGRVLRRVDAASVRETWTDHDPELRQRAILAPRDRRGLTTRIQSVNE